jgi:hypothetical protein
MPHDSPSANHWCPRRAFRGLWSIIASVFLTIVLNLMLRGCSGFR